MVDFGFWLDSIASWFASHWTTVSLLVLGGILLWAYARGEKRSLVLGTGLSFIGLVTVGATLLSSKLTPEEGWGGYFSALLQGHSALLGIFAAGAFVGYQLATEEYGPEVSRSVFGASYHGKVALGLSVAVLLLTTLALGLSPVHPWGSFLAGVVFLAGFGAFAFAGSALTSVISGLGPGNVVPALMCKLVASNTSKKGTWTLENAVWHLATLLGRYAEKGPGPWREALVAYRMRALQVLKDSSPERKPEAVLSLLGPLHLLDLSEQPHRRGALVMHLRQIMRHSWDSYPVVWYIYHTCRETCPKETVEQFRKTIERCFELQRKGNRYFTRRIVEFMVVLHSASCVYNIMRPNYLLEELLLGVNPPPDMAEAFETLRSPDLRSHSELVASLVSCLKAGTDEVSQIAEGCRKAIDKLRPLSSHPTLFFEDDVL